jgi:hypothetical protein
MVNIRLSPKICDKPVRTICDGVACHKSEIRRSDSGAGYRTRKAIGLPPELPPKITTT